MGQFRPEEYSFDTESVRIAVSYTHLRAHETKCYRV